MNTKSHLISTIALVFLFCACKNSNNDTNWNEAIEKTTNWLNIIDNFGYENSWTAASPAFQSAVPKDTWIDSLKKSREPLGKIRSRKVENKNYTTHLPGFPKGEYVILQYKTEFMSEKSAIETVTMQHAKNDDWLALGYYIK